jgi:hypothetical protein
MIKTDYLTVTSTWMMHALHTFSADNKYRNGHRTLLEWMHEIVRSFAWYRRTHRFSTLTTFRKRGKSLIL